LPPHPGLIWRRRISGDGYEGKSESNGRHRENADHDAALCATKVAQDLCTKYVKARPDERTFKRLIEFGSAHVRPGRIVAITLNSR
jgi:hypothetical protein